MMRDERERGGGEGEERREPGRRKRRRGEERRGEERGGGRRGEYGRAMTKSSEGGGIPLLLLLSN